MGGVGGVLGEAEGSGGFEAAEGVGRDGREGREFGRGGEVARLEGVRRGELGGKRRLMRSKLRKWIDVGRADGTDRMSVV